jgi:DNA-binding MarR family transcriptional regulator
VPPKTKAKAPRADRREELYAAVDNAGRELSTVAVMFHGQLAELQGLSATDVKSLDLVIRFGPLTAGELAQRSGLSKASVTGLVDRLVQKGFALRKDDPNDGRRVLVEFVPESQARLKPYFVDLMARLRVVYADFSDEELRIAIRFMQRISACQAEATQHLSALTPER